MVQHNYLIGQYDETNPIAMNHNYLKEQFADYALILKEIEQLVIDGDFTLGRAVNEFEANIRDIIKAKHVIGVGSGTDALFLSLKALGVGPGDEVITTPYSFVATCGAIVTAGAKPVFVDVRDDYNIDPSLIEKAITKRTKAILPVHWSGLICDMDAIGAVATKHNLAIVEDACHAIKAEQAGRFAGTFGATGCFSLHPLKNLNVWGDGGYIATNSDALHEKLVLLRNHGLVDRNTCAVYAYNSRLDSLQAIVGNHLLKKLEHITNSRIAHATYLDRELASVDGIRVPVREARNKQVFHLYVIRAQRRDELQKFLVSHGIDAKVHYPVPLHLQPAAKEFGYHKGQFPVCEKICDEVISFPVHEFITEAQLAFTVQKVKEFYGAR